MTITSQIDGGTSGGWCLWMGKKKNIDVKNSGYSEGGASHKNNILKSWDPLKLSSKADIDVNLSTLRGRSADQAINTPIGAAAISTSATHTIGAGLRASPRIRYKLLGLTDKEAREWNKKTLAEFNVWANSKYADIYKRNNFFDLQDIIYTAYLIDGDSFALFRRQAPTSYMPYSLRLQVLEGNRVSNPLDMGVSNAFVETNAPNGNKIISGVEIDKVGAIVAYWISNKVPNDPFDIENITEWQRVKAFGNLTGAPNILQICHDTRADQYRGVPYLAPVLETLKQLSRYTTAELTAAIIKSFFALFFVETPTGASLGDVLPSAFEGDKNTPCVNVSDYGLGPGTMNALPAGVDVKAIDAGRSMSTFDAFITQLIKQVGAAIGQPYEVLMKNFTSSYSASRAALLQAWDEYKLRREWFARDFCQPVYETWLTEAIAIGRIEAPGFFEDPLIRAAWCNADWYGPTMSILDPVKDATGSDLRVQFGLSTREREAAEMTGTDFEENLEQLAYETNLMREKGLQRGENVE